LKVRNNKTGTTMQEIIASYTLTDSKCLIANASSTRSAKRISETYEVRDLTEEGDWEKRQQPTSKTCTISSAAHKA
jgi:hypothetical protein